MGVARSYLWALVSVACEILLGRRSHLNSKPVLAIYQLLKLSLLLFKTNKLIKPVDGHEAS